MNFLAHCALAHDAAQQWQCEPDQREGLLAGAVIGDFVKGPIPTHWPTPLRAGVRWHRKIDALSNRNHFIRQTCQRYPTELRRFAPIFVDLLADHCLSHVWSDYYAELIEVFSAQCYAAISTYEGFLAPEGQRLFGYMLEQDLLANYHQWRHVERGIASVLRRLSRTELSLTAVISSCQDIVSSAQQDFAGYYPQLRAAPRSWNAFTA